MMSIRKMSEEGFLKDGGYETDNMASEEIEEYIKDCQEAIDKLDKDRTNG